MLTASTLPKQHTDGGAVRYLVNVEQSKLLYFLLKLNVLHILNSYNICQNCFMYDFLLLFVSMCAFGISSCILSEIKLTVWATGTPVCENTLQCDKTTTNHNRSDVDR